MKVIAIRVPAERLTLQQTSPVNWMHEDPVTKSKHVTNSSGAVVRTIELDPWGADTNRSSNQAFQPKRFTSYERDGNASDEAMFRRYNRWHSRFDQPDPYDGSYDLTDPQSFNRYAYVQNDPVNFTDPLGLDRFDDHLGPPPPILVPPQGPLPREIINTGDRAIQLGTTDWGGFQPLPVVPQNRRTTPPARGARQPGYVNQFVLSGSGVNLCWWETNIFPAAFPEVSG